MGGVWDRPIIRSIDHGHRRGRVGRSVHAHLGGAVKATVYIIRGDRVVAYSDVGLAHRAQAIWGGKLVWAPTTCLGRVWFRLRWGVR